MILLLMRHGIAEEISPGSDTDDAQRELTGKGMRRVKDMARFLEKMDIQPTHYAASPRTRAQQTARLVARELDWKRKIATLPSLDFAGTWGEFVQEALELTKGKSSAVLLAAGHEPSCSEFLKQALLPVHHSMPFKKGAIAALRWDGPISEREAALMFYMTGAAVKGVG
jgi:phosphohistidine phosphatase